MQMSPIDITQKMRHRFTMRTTLTLDDDILERAARQAKLRGASLSTQWHK
jgi:Arc/MetJ family transcription regulator